ncbi:MAG: hypothetical protein ACXWL9_05140 [Syntrophales bacterium]
MCDKYKPLYEIKDDIQIIFTDEAKTLPIEAFFIFQDVIGFLS